MAITPAEAQFDEENVAHIEFGDKPDNRFQFENGEWIQWEVPSHPDKPTGQELSDWHNAHVDAGLYADWRQWYREVMHDAEFKTLMVQLAFNPATAGVPIVLAQIAIWLLDHFSDVDSERPSVVDIVSAWTVAFGALKANDISLPAATIERFDTARAALLLPVDMDLAEPVD